MEKESKLEKLKMYSKVIGYTLAGLTFSGLIALAAINRDKKEDIQNRYNEIFIKESLTAEDTLNFYEKHNLMNYTIFHYNDLMKGDANRWEFLPLPDSAIERIVKENEELNKK